jgi:hypothetical protein
LVRSVARQRGLPAWWVEAMAVEYCDCRDYATRDEIWTFTFDRVTETDLKDAIDNHRVVVHGLLFHNVHEAVQRSRMLRGLIGRSPYGIAEHEGDVLPDGPVSPYHTPFLANPIDVWDPKLDFSRCFQVFDQGRIWQWRIADFDQSGTWTSGEVDLSPLAEISKRLRTLRNPVIKVGERGHEHFRAGVQAFYRWVDEVRMPILRALEKIHHRRVAATTCSTYTATEPPLLSHFEMFTVKDNQLKTRFFAEPVFLRACRAHAGKAEELLGAVSGDIDLVEVLDHIYEARATAIVMGAMSCEAFVNGILLDEFPSLFASVEKLTPPAKYQLLLELKGSRSYDSGKPPFQTLVELHRRRNGLIHYKRGYKNVLNLAGKTATSFGELLQPAFVRDLAGNVEKLFRHVCNVTAIPLPRWLNAPDYGL